MTLYRVDKTDRQNPLIVPAEAEGDDSKSFEECKAEIIADAEDYIGALRVTINLTRALTEPGTESL